MTNVKMTARLEAIIAEIKAHAPAEKQTEETESRIIGCDDGNELIAIVNGKSTARYTFGARS